MPRPSATSKPPSIRAGPLTTVKETGKPEEAVATSAVRLPAATPAGSGKLIVCLPGLITKVPELEPWKEVESTIAKTA
ncbi:MAG: hypothetical protein RLZZ221_2798 [Verrucomicrobiota bacterium]